MQYGYVIRDEKIAKGENTQNGIYEIKAEGEKTANGEIIFRYYSNKEDELNNSIKDLNNKIQEAMLRTNRFVFCRYKSHRKPNRSKKTSKECQGRRRLYCI